jgi:hypothetical protein
LTDVKDTGPFAPYRSFWSVGRKEYSLNERLAEKLSDSQIAHDVRVSGDFVRVYCDDHHTERERRPLASAGVDEGCYRTPPVLCDECAALQVYAEKRRAFCPYDPKPFCSACETHCYQPDYREQMRVVMREAGPQFWRHGHPVDGVKHVRAMRQHKREIARNESEGQA